MLSTSEQIEKQFRELSRAIAATSVVAEVLNKLEEDSDCGEPCEHCNQLIDSKPDWYTVYHQKSLILAFDVLASHTDWVFSRLENLRIEQREGEQSDTTDTPAWMRFDYKEIAGLSDDAIDFAIRLQQLEPERRKAIIQKVRESKKGEQ